MYRRRRRPVFRTNRFSPATAIRSASVSSHFRTCSAIALAQVGRRRVCCWLRGVCGGSAGSRPWAVSFSPAGRLRRKRAPTGAARSGAGAQPGRVRPSTPALRLSREFSAAARLSAARPSRFASPPRLLPPSLPDQTWYVPAKISKKPTLPFFFVNLLRLHCIV